jgi:hypothetical protein
MKSASRIRALDCQSARNYFTFASGRKDTDCYINNDYSLTSIDFENYYFLFQSDFLILFIKFNVRRGPFELKHFYLLGIGNFPLFVSHPLPAVSDKSHFQ